MQLNLLAMPFFIMNLDYFPFPHSFMNLKGQRANLCIAVFWGHDLLKYITVEMVTHYEIKDEFSLFNIIVVY